MRARDHSRLVTGYVVAVNAVRRIGTCFGFQEIYRVQWCDLETLQTHWTRSLTQSYHTGYR
ncbi:hypothetical protein [Algirhabdus cladophorae]|uniref:hypothetical protein n=1 Tax=Algirhabdus cladophorae TaxID=3377108 RepID=UPI003B847C5B